MAELYGSCEASFGMLFNWKAEVTRLMPNSVVEIDVECFKHLMDNYVKKKRVQNICGLQLELIEKMCMVITWLKSIVFQM
jgi:hypothetical protein